MALCLSGCGAVNSYMASSVADVMPEWAGGLPKDAPPRPTDPRYSDYLKEQDQKLGIKPGEDPAAATAAPANTGSVAADKPAR